MSTKYSPQANNNGLSWPSVTLALCFLVIGGCGGGQLASNQVQDAQQAMDQAIAALASENYAEAMISIESALAAPGLDPDQYATALLIRAQCHAEAGDIEAAEADLAEAELGAPSEAARLFAVAFVLHRKGDTDGAKKEFAKARRLDSSLKAPW